MFVHTADAVSAWETVELATQGADSLGQGKSSGVLPLQVLCKDRLAHHIHHINFCIEMSAFFSLLGYMCICPVPAGAPEATTAAIKVKCCLTWDQVLLLLVVAPHRLHVPVSSWCAVWLPISCTVCSVM